MKSFNLNDENTIAAISSGNNQNQAISIIRISGSESKKIAEKITNCKLKNRQIKFTKILENSKILDEVLITYFKKPESFTGEDVVEIFCHGNVVNTQVILNFILKQNIRLAEPGEFSFRAFLNQKMDVFKAKSINNLINAKTKQQANLLSEISFNKKYVLKISEIQKDIENIIGICEVNIDYPEYDDVEEINSHKLKNKIKKIIIKINQILKKSHNISKVFKGYKVAIIGPPNSGKSSLMNSILKENRVIVSNIAGTTRDAIEASIEINDILFNFIDTAGIRKTKNKIENFGINKTFEIMKKADFILYVLDGSKIKKKEILNLKNKYLNNNKKIIWVLNKKDLISSDTVKKLDDLSLIYITALKNEINNLIKEIINKIPKISLEKEFFLWDTREINLIKIILLNLENAIKGLSNNLGFEVVITDIREAWTNLGKISGNIDDELLLTNIFKNFCLGK